MASIDFIDSKFVMPTMKCIKGVAHPIPFDLIERFFEGKDVFIKPATVFKSLQPGMTFYLYRSRRYPGFIGEAKIKSIAISDNPEELYQRYSNRVYLTEDEFRDYRNGLSERWQRKRRENGPRKKRLWIAFELESIQRYKVLEWVGKVVPVGGMYIYEPDE